MGSGFSLGGWGLGDNSYGKSAYMLIYERKEKRPIKVVIRDEELQSEREKNVNIEIVRDEKKEENYKMIDYRNGVQDIVANQIYKQVFEDNKKFEFENDIYSQEFFNFIKSIIVAVTQLKESQQSQEAIRECKVQIMKIAKKAILEIIAKCFYNKCITNMVEVFIELLKSDPDLPSMFM